MASLTIERLIVSGVLALAIYGSVRIVSRLVSWLTPLCRRTGMLVGDYARVGIVMLATLRVGIVQMVLLVGLGALLLRFPVAGILSAWVLLVWLIPKGSN